MDFASLMKAEITKSSKAKSAPSGPAKTKSTSTSAESTPTQSRYARRAEIEAARESAYRQEQEAAATAKREKELKRRRDEDEEREKSAAREAKKRRLAEESRARREEEAAKEEAARRKRLGLPPLSEKKAVESGTADEDKETGDVSEEELRVRLRALKEPVMLFAETHAARVRRYRALTAVKDVLSDTPIPTRLALLPEAECQVPAKPGPAALKEERSYLYRQLASYFTLVMIEWERALAGRSAEVKESYPGRQAGLAYASSRENMRPLFRAFEKGDMDDKILEGVVEIVNKAQRRRYVDASDAYLTLSIGKAAWPIGVTMVGIHERSAREKLHEHDQKAHIMSDEVTRKYLQAIKQCLSFAQTRWPPDDHLQLMG